MRERVKPTRRELSRVSRDLGLAREGCSILRDKNSVLVRAFHDYTRDLERVDRELGERSKSSWDAVWSVLGEHGLSGGFLLGLSTTPQEDRISVRERRLMGVRVHDVVVEPLERKWTERGYGLLETTESVDRASREWERVLPLALRAGAIETNRLRIAIGARKTRRRVSAIESVLIPELEGARRRVLLALEEHEREEILRTKRVKNKRYGAGKVS